MLFLLERPGSTSRIPVQSTGKRWSSWRRRCNLLRWPSKPVLFPLEGCRFQWGTRIRPHRRTSPPGPAWKQFFTINCLWMRICSRRFPVLWVTGGIFSTWPTLNQWTETDNDTLMERAHFPPHNTHKPFFLYRLLWNKKPLSPQLMPLQLASHYNPSFFINKGLCNALKD